MKKVFSSKYLVVSLIAFLLSTVYCLLSTSTQAASPSPSASANPSLTEFQQKVEDIKKDAATKAAQLKTQVSQTIQNKAFIGKITEIKDKQIILESKNGQKTVMTDEYTAYQEVGNKKAVTLKDFKKDDFIICLGDVDDKKVLKAKKIIRTKAPEPKEKLVVWGQVQSVIINALTILKSDDQKITINTGSGTQFRLGSEEITVQDIKPNNFIISVGGKLNNNASSAQFVLLLNPKGDLKITKSASASATPSASPKPK